MRCGERERKNSRRSHPRCQLLATYRWGSGYLLHDQCVAKCGQQWATGRFNSLAVDRESPTAAPILLTITRQRPEVRQRQPPFSVNHSNTAMPSNFTLWVFLFCFPLGPCHHCHDDDFPFDGQSSLGLFAFLCVLRVKLATIAHCCFPFFF